MADSSFFTQATNFVNAISGGVDPRTGIFNLNMKLGTVKGNEQMGPSIPIVLSYSPLNVDDIGFGIGVTLGVTRFGNANPNQLFLSSGEQYTVQKSGGVEVNQKKLNNFKFEKEEDDDDSFRVTHKTGDIEILKDTWNTEVINAAGHKLRMLPNDLGKFSNITDDSEVNLLNVEYDDNDTIIFSFYPDQQDMGAADYHKEYYTVTLATNNGYLQSVTIAADNGIQLVWQLTYVDVGHWGRWVDSLTLPTGMVEKVVYNTGDDAMAFPSEYPDSLKDNPYPCVKEYTQTPQGNQPEIVVNYEYYYLDADNDDEQVFHNYLGQNSDAEYDPSSDGLYGVASDYKYGSREIRVVDNNTTTTTRIYNSYHLEISEAMQTGDNTVTKATTYYTKDNASFDDQLAIFQMPAKVTTTWSNTQDTYSEEIVTEFDGISLDSADDQGNPTKDGDGNPTKKVAADGTTTLWEYYPADGLEGSCPADPNGFKRYIKTQTVTAPSNAYNSVTSHKTEYTYANFAVMTNDVVSSLVLKKQEVHYADTTKLQTIVFDYDSGSLAGRLKSKVTTHHGEAENGSAKNYTTTETYTRTDDSTYSYVKNFNVATDKDGANPSLSVTHSQTHSKLTGRKWSQTDIQAMVTDYKYDQLGRKTERTLNPQTAYSNTMKYSYIIDADETIPVYAITTDEQGNKKRYALDGGKRHLHTEVNDVDHDGVVDDEGSVVWYKIQEQHYDAQGRKLKAIVNDFTLTENARSADPSESLEQALLYDDWGQVSQSTFSDGIIHLTTTDPINLTTTTQEYSEDKNTLGAITVTTHAPKTRNPIKIQVYNPGSAPGELGTLCSTATHTYNGWKQLITETVPSATKDTSASKGDSTTTYSYDIWGRISNTTLPDNKVIKRKYAGFSAHKLVTEIGLQAGSKYYKQGTQKFDLLGRLTEKVSADRTWGYIYDKASDNHPASITAPDKVKELYTYIPELGDKTATVSAGNIAQNFTYDKKLGHLTNSTAKDGSVTTVTIDYTYYTSGLLNSRKATRGTKSASTKVNTYTVAGKAISAQDFSDSLQTSEHDSYGRIIKQTDGNIETDIVWDGLGRLSSWTVTDKKNPSNNVRKTSLGYDAQGREISRTIIDNDDVSNALTIVQTWYINHQLKTRITTKGSQTLRSETYKYNVRNQLIDYEVTGTSLPKDETGSALGSQTYTYTDLGGIQTRDSTYPKESASRKYNTTTFSYNNADKCQASNLRNSNVASGLPANINFSYDSAGRMITDEKNRTRQYDDLGRLIAVLDAQKQNLISYNYDAHNRMAAHQPKGATATEHYYHGDTLSYLTDDSNSVRLVRFGGHVVAQDRSGSDNPGVWLTGTDMMGSVLNVRNKDSEENYQYTPYGENGPAKK